MARRKYVLKIVSDKEKLSERVDEFNFELGARGATAAIRDLKDTLIANPQAEALAAPQIGKKYRLFCLKFAGNDIRAFINPVITKSKGSVLSRETNLSLKGKEFIVPRAEEIQAAYTTPVGRSEENIFKGRAAALFQQMVELLDGLTLDTEIPVDDDTFITRGLEVIEGFDEAPEAEKEEVIEFYINNIKKALDLQNKKIDDDPTLSKVKENMEFLKSVALGETDLLSYEKDKAIIDSFKEER